MKKTILGVAILLITLMVMMGSVNAATNVAASSAKVNVNENVDITVTADTAFEAVEFEMSYDASKFDFIGASCAFGDPSATANNGVVTVAGFSTNGSANTVTLTFKAKAETEAKDFTVSALNIRGEQLGNATAQVAVGTNGGASVVTPPEVNGGTTSNNNGATNGTGTAAKGEDGQQIIGTDGKAITKLPQTGAPVFVGAIALIVVAGVVLAIRKRIK